MRTQQPTIQKRQQSETSSMKKLNPNYFVQKRQLNCSDQKLKTIRDHANSFEKMQASKKQLKNQENLKISTLLYEKIGVKSYQHTSASNLLSKKVVIKLQSDKENNPFVNQLQTFEQRDRSAKIPEYFHTEVPQCYIHNFKSAKYRVGSQQMCSKCTIDYAIKQGLPIKQSQSEKLLTFGPEDESRRRDLLQMSNISQVSQNATFKYASVQSFLTKLNDLVDESKSLISQIKLQKTDGHSIILNTQESILKDIQDNNINVQKLRQDANTFEIEDSLEKCVTDVESIKVDILENISNIVECMEMVPFKIIIGKYMEKLQSLKYVILLNKVNQHQATNSLFYNSVLTSIHQTPTIEYSLSKGKRYKTEMPQSQKPYE